MLSLVVHICNPSLLGGGHPGLLKKIKKTNSFMHVGLIKPFLAHNKCQLTATVIPTASQYGCFPRLLSALSPLGTHRNEENADSKASYACQYLVQ
jgi:hypothetical protein